MKHLSLKSTSETLIVNGGYNLIIFNDIKNMRQNIVVKEKTLLLCMNITS